MEKKIVQLLRLLFTLYTDPKPPAPNLLFIAKLSVALDMVIRSKIGNSVSSFHPSLLESFWHLVFIPETVRETLSRNNFDNCIAKSKLLTTLSKISSGLKISDSNYPAKNLLSCIKNCKNPSHINYLPF